MGLPLNQVANRYRFSVTVHRETGLSEENEEERRSPAAHRTKSIFIDPPPPHLRLPLVKRFSNEWLPTRSGHGQVGGRGVMISPADLRDVFLILESFGLKVRGSTLSRCRWWPAFLLPPDRTR